MTLPLTCIYHQNYECVECNLLIYLFIVYLTRLLQLLRLYSVQWKNATWMMTWKGCRRKWSRPNLRYYPSTCLKEWRKTLRNLSQDSQSPGWDLNLEPPEYKARELVTQPWCSVMLPSFQGKKELLIFCRKVPRQRYNTNTQISCPDVQMPVYEEWLLNDETDAITYV
jgi:hypothetical protein